MNWKWLLGVCFWTLFFFKSCRNDDISFSSPSQELRLSTQTLVMDTVYHQFRSATYQVKIFNQENKNISIPKIYLEQGANSQYRINIDGKAGHSFQNIPLRAKDSLLIFVEIVPNASSSELIVEDNIKIETSQTQQQIKLLSVVQNAEFINSPKENPKIINENTTWDNSKVKIILGELQLAEGKTLSINKGTKIYFMPNSSLKINQNAVLNVNGDLNEEVIFRGHRNEAQYDTLPKNWNAIVLDKDAKININYAKIFGGTTGLYLDHATASIKNTIIHTFQDYGVFAINAHVHAENLVMNNSGIANIGITKGGKYEFLHTTLANFWTHSHQSALAIHAQNSWITSNGNTETADLQLILKNSIAYTQKNNAIKLVKNDKAQLNYSFENSLIKYHTDAGYSWDNNPLIINSFINVNPLFINHHTSKMNLRTAPSSPTKGKGKVATAQLVPMDIKKTPRTTLPTIGAYQ